MNKLNFSQILNWFGNRGLEVSKEDFKKLGCDAKYIYWKPNNKKCAPDLRSESKNNILWCARNSMYMEIEDEQDESKVTFKDWATNE